MKNKVLQFIFVSTILGIAYFTNISFSAGPPDSAVTGGCTCHGAANANTLVSINFNNGGGLNYNNGQTYPLQITVSSQANKPGAGFALSYNIGSLTPVTPNTQVSGGVWKHSVPRNATGSNPSVTTWSANWTAPASGNTPLQLKAAGNAVSLSAGSSLDEWNFASDLNIPLPVFFEALHLNVAGHLVNVQWDVVNEKNIERYDVMKSSDGISFELIQSMQAANAETKHGYAVYDPIRQAGDIYYMVVAHDLNGHSFQSTIASLGISADMATTLLMPNTVRQGEMVRVQHADQAGSELHIVNSIGQPILKIPLTGSSTQFNTSPLPAGMYFVTWHNGYTQKLVDRLLVR